MTDIDSDKVVDLLASLASHHDVKAISDRCVASIMDKDADEVSEMICYRRLIEDGWCVASHNPQSVGDVFHFVPIEDIRDEGRLDNAEPNEQPAETPDEVIENE
jgi:hypothetical protein